MTANTSNSQNESYHVWKLRGVKRLWRVWYDADGKKRTELVRVNSEDLETAESVERAKAIWKNELISYPCHYCGKQMQITLDELRFMSIHMLNRYEIGALPCCSKACAEKLVELYDKCKCVKQEDNDKLKIIQQHTGAD